MPKLAKKTKQDYFLPVDDLLSIYFSDNLSSQYAVFLAHFGLTTLPLCNFYRIQSIT